MHNNENRILRFDKNILIIIVYTTELWHLNLNLKLYIFVFVFHYDLEPHEEQCKVTWSCLGLLYRMWLCKIDELVLQTILLLVYWFRITILGTVSRILIHGIY